MFQYFTSPSLKPLKDSSGAWERGERPKSRATSRRHERSGFVVRSSATSSQGRRRREEMAHAGHGGANRGRRYSGVGVLSDIVNLAATPKR